MADSYMPIASHCFDGRRCGIKYWWLFKKRKVLNSRWHSKAWKRFICRYRSKLYEWNCAHAGLAWYSRQAAAKMLAFSNSASCAAYSVYKSAVLGGCRYVWRYAKRGDPARSVHVYTRRSHSKGSDCWRSALCRAALYGAGMEPAAT